MRFPRPLGLALLSAALLAATPVTTAYAAAPAGTLTIVNNAPTGASGTFTFGLNPSSATGQTSVSVAAGATSAAISMSPTTALAITVGVPAGYGAFSVNCVAKGAATGTLSGNTVSTVKIVTGKDTTCTFNQTAAPINLVAKLTAAPATVLDSGGTVTYTYKVTNPNTAGVTLTELSDTASGTLAGGSGCAVGSAIAAGASCSFTAARVLPADAVDTVVGNTFTASAVSGATSSATATDSASVTYVASPELAVSVSYSPAFVPHFGGWVTGNYTVENTSATAITLSYLNDEGLTLVGPADCKVGTVLPAGASCSFSKPAEFGTSNAYATLSRTFRARATANGATATASAVGSVTVVTPSSNLTITASASPLTVPAVGGPTAVTYTITNHRGEPATVRSTFDTLTGGAEPLSECGAGTVINAFSSCTGTWDIYLSGPAGGTFNLGLEVYASTDTGYFVGAGSTPIHFS